MDSERWQQIKILFNQVADIAVSQRESALQKLCADADLRREVLNLFASEEQQSQGLATVVQNSAKSLVIESARLSAGDRVGPYIIHSVLGDGGMGIVYLAERSDEQFEQRVAIKFSRHPGANDQLSQQIQLEQQLLGQLEHPNIARIFDAGVSADGHPFLVMEFVDGIAIDKYCSQTHITIDDILQLVLSLTEAVQYAHQRGIIHRDLKPANILVADVNGRPFPKIIDFGIAQNRHTESSQSSHLSGTPVYMSPEQFARGAPSTQTDVYSLGLVAYRLLCGALPFNNQDSPQSLVQAKQAVLPPASQYARECGGRLNLNTELDAILAKATAPNPEQRYATAQEFGADIQRYRQNLPVSAIAQTTAYLLKKIVQRQRVLVTASALVVVSLLVAVVVSTQALLQEREARQQLVLESEKVQAVNNYLVDMISAVDPRREGIQVRVVDMLDRAESNIDVRLKDNPPLQASLYQTFGETRQGLGEYERAEALLQKAVDIFTSEFGDEHLDTLTASTLYFENIASMGKSAEALAGFKQLLTIARANLGEEHPLTMTLINNTAVNSYFVGSDNDDEEMRQQSLLLMAELLQLRTRVLGERHENTSHTRNNLASMSEFLDQPERARQLYQENLAIQREIFGLENYFTLATMSNLANVQASLGELQQAQTLAQQALSGLINIQGEDHPDTHRTRIVLVEIYLAQDATQEADEQLIAMQSFFAADPNRIGWLSTAAQAYYQQKYNIAEQPE